MVDDNPDDCFLLKRALGKGVPGLMMVCLHNCDEAIAYLSGSAPFHDRAKHPLPGVVVIDIDLRGKSGLELLVWIRKHPTLKDLPAVVLSQSLWETDRKTAGLVGASAYYSKPTDFEQLVATAKDIGKQCLAHL
jgi:CheY-like chemotaxis protein